MSFESDLKQIWNFLMWGAGISGTAFISLFGVLITLVKDRNMKLKELEKKVDDSLVLKESLIRMTKSMERIEGCLLGSYENPKGLVHRQNDLEKEINHLRIQLEKE